jgi:hypothetical protein
MIGFFVGERDSAWNFATSGVKVRSAGGTSQGDFSDCKLCLQYENLGVAERDEVLSFLPTKNRPLKPVFGWWGVIVSATPYQNSIGSCSESTLRCLVTVNHAYIMHFYLSIPSQYVQFLVLHQPQCLFRFLPYVILAGSLR